MMHPIFLFLLSLSIILLTLITPSPIVLLFSFIISLLWGALIKVYTTKYTLFNCFFIVLIAVINPIIVQKGATVLFDFGNFVYTLEALIYGIFSGIMIGAIINWSIIFHFYIDSQHITYLLSGMYSTLGLLFSMILRIIPRFKQQYIEVSNVQSMFLPNNLIKRHIVILLTMFTWLFESSLEIIQSMHVRHYNSQRTHFYLFTFNKKDLYGCIFLLILNFSLFLLRFKIHKLYYYPIIRYFKFDIFDIIYTLLGLTIFLHICLLKKEE